MKIENPHHFFYACNGYILENLDDLVVLLRDCDDGTFFYHANEHKNDFANWTRDIIQDNTLAKALFKKKSKKDMMKLVYDLSLIHI